ncbi:hypothetical protein Leryth_003518 [Lithospermum erythrorhizon]|nr:hypothetical protein Leryth_003518 [Lithospermum erythrorhizon]
MQPNNMYHAMRSLKIVEGCKRTHVYILHPNSNSTAGLGGSVGEKFFQHLHDHLRVNSIRTKSTRGFTNFLANNNDNSSIENLSILADAMTIYGLPQSDFIEPQIEPCLKFVNFVETLAENYVRIQSSDQLEKSGLYLEQCAIFKGLHDPKLFRRGLRCARQHSIDVHSKVVLSAWLRFDRREDELIGISAMDCCGRNMECPKTCLISGYNPESFDDPCDCRRISREDRPIDIDMRDEECSTSFSGEVDEDYYDMSFCVGDEEIRCRRFDIASLSQPFQAMLYGGFMESRREKINFTQNEISANAMKAAEEYSRTKKLNLFEPELVLELLVMANRFCCEQMKSACDEHLASLVIDMDIAMLLVEYGLEETAYLLVAACLQVFLRELPNSMRNPNVVRFFCSSEGREKLVLVGHASFLLYYFLSQFAMEEDMKSNTTVMLLERLGECASQTWEKQLAFHQLGCVMLERKEFKDAQKWFEAAVDAGHTYSLVGVARAKYVAIIMHLCIQNDELSHLRLYICRMDVSGAILVLRWESRKSMDLLIPHY